MAGINRPQGTQRQGHAEEEEAAGDVSRMPDDGVGTGVDDTCDHGRSGCGRSARRTCSPTLPRSAREPRDQQGIAHKQTHHGT